MLATRQSKYPDMFDNRFHSSLLLGSLSRSTSNRLIFGGFENGIDELKLVLYKLIVLA